MELLFFLISFFASIVGAICGIGGGVIIKPVLDLFQMADISTINFLSGCTVLSMSSYSVAKFMLAGERRVTLAIGTPLAIGAAVGGLLGNQTFALLKSLFADQNMVGAVQAICLGAITLGTLLYTLNKSNIIPRETKGTLSCVVIGLLLGVISSFLGIGGGPINLVVLHYFFKMETKDAAANSLYIIFFSQLANLIVTIVTNTIPGFPWLWLVLMAGGGIGGGIVGRIFTRKMDNHAVDRLFVALMAIIIGISIYNFLRCMGV